MTEREKLIEAMASALYSAGFGAEFDYARRGDPVKGRYRTQAAAALAAIEATGAVVVMSGQCSHSGVCKAAQEEPS
jgi:hypothetical protein